jgi:hypothetical protein
MASATGFAWTARPTARAAAGLPTVRATSPYDRVSPAGIVRNAV